MSNFNTNNSALYLGYCNTLEDAIEKCQFGAYDMLVRTQVEILGEPYPVSRNYVAQSWDNNANCLDNGMAVDIKCKNTFAGKVYRNWDYISVVYNVKTTVLARRAALND